MASETMVSAPASVAKGPEMPDIEIHAVPRPATEPPPGPLGFGRLFTDHMLVAEYEEGRGYGTARIIPYGPLVLDPATAAFHYGQTMFEGLKAFRGADGSIRIFRLLDHCRRLREGAARLCMVPPEPEQMAAMVRAIVAQDKAWIPAAPGAALYIRPTLVASEPFLGVRPSRRYLFFVILCPVDPYYGAAPKPLRIWIEEQYSRAAPGGLGGVKAGGNYGASLLAAREAQERGFDQVLWLDAAEHRHPEELGMMNLFVKMEGRLLTPPLQGTILGGITRDSVLKLARRWGIPAAEERFTVDDLRRAAAAGKLEEVFGCGTAAVIAPVAELGTASGAIRIGDGMPGPVALRLLDAIGSIQRGTTADPDGWSVPVA